MQAILEAKRWVPFLVSGSVWVWAGVRAPVADLCRLIRVYKLP